MYNSGITAKQLIEGLKSEVDIALDIPDESYIQWLNGVEQLLYSEIIKEQKEECLPFSNGSFVDLNIEPPILGGGDASRVRFEDIYAVFADDIQLIKTNLTSGAIFSDCYFKKDDGLGYSVKIVPETLKIVYFVRPALKSVDNVGTKNVMVPVEFLDLVKAKLRGEAYKLANEDNLAAKWLNDYNVLLENFKAWIADKTSQFGM